MMGRALVLAGALALLASQAHAGGGANALGGANSGGNVVTSGTPTTASASITGTYFYQAFGGASIGNITTALLQNQARCTAFYWQWTSHVDKAVFNITVVGSGPLNIALYTDGFDTVTGRHQPQTLITDPSLTINTASVGFVTDTLGTLGVGVPLQKGINWVCVNDAAASDPVRYAGLVPSSSYMANLVGSTNAAFVGSANNVGATTFNITAGTTTANWPSFAGQTFTDTVPQPSAPAPALEIATVP